MTLEQISILLGTVTTIITSLIFLAKKLKAFINNTLDNRFSAIDDKIEALCSDIRKVDVETTKSYLIQTIVRIERGELLDDIETQRFWEQYEHYIERGGNGYVKRMVDKLKTEYRI